LPLNAGASAPWFWLKEHSLNSKETFAGMNIFGGKEKTWFEVDD